MVDGQVDEPEELSCPRHSCWRRGLTKLVFFAITFPLPVAVLAAPPRRIALPTRANDVIPTGNEWVALPTIRAADGALMSFNVLSMRDRGLLQVVGDSGNPALQPYILIGDNPVPFRDLSWQLIEYWIPVATFTADGAGAAFATAAGYVAHAICQEFCKN